MQIPILIQQSFKRFCPHHPCFPGAQPSLAPPAGEAAALGGDLFDQFLYQSHHAATPLASPATHEAPALVLEVPSGDRGEGWRWRR